ncbi:MAG TPA: YheC/YheD family protein [Thermaerobacter sp.]
MTRVKVVPLSGSAAPGWVQLGSGLARIPYHLDADRRVLALPRNFLDRCGCAPEQDLHAYPVDGRLVIGPLLGIWVRSSALRSWQRGIRTFDREARAAGALPFFFDLDGIDRAAGRITGWTAAGERVRRVTLPLPDVIYNRATFPDLRERAAARAMRQALLEEELIPFVNVASGFPKWDTYRTLRRFTATRHLVPETIRFGDRAALARFLRRHRLVYMKSNTGSHGTEVLRLEADPAGGWSVKGQIGNRRVQTRVATTAQLCSLLPRLVGSKEWVVQRGIRLPRLQGRRWDLRIEVKKDGTGRWTVPLVLVRLGNPASVTTNISRGATPFTLEEFLRRFRDAPGVAGLEEKATRVGRLVAVALEATYGGLGEIGVDMGLDPAGRPWVFEANTKPQYGPRPRSRQVRGVMAYAVHLALRAWAGREAGGTGRLRPLPAQDSFPW